MTKYGLAGIVIVYALVIVSLVIRLCCFDANTVRFLPVLYFFSLKRIARAGILIVPPS